MIDMTASDVRAEVLIECTFQQLITASSRAQRVAAGDRLRMSVAGRSAAQVRRMERRKGLLHER